MSLKKLEEAEAPLRKAFGLAKNDRLFIKDSKFLLGVCLRKLRKF